MKIPSRIFKFMLVSLVFLLSACGGSGGGGDDAVVGGSTSTIATTGITSGIAVDPYISNAQFKEIGADGKFIQNSNGRSNDTGHFSFTNEISDGSIIVIVDANKGLHAKEPFNGVIKRQVFFDDVDPVVISPLTSLLANGMSPDAVLQMMSSAGLSGLTEVSLYTNPMAALDNKTSDLTDEDLILLQANMAVSAFMLATQNFNYGGVSTLAVSPVSFADIAAMVQENLSPIRYQQMVSANGADFTVIDMIDTAVKVTNFVAKEIQAEVASGSQNVPASTITQFMISADPDAIASSVYHDRTGGGTMPPTTDPGTGGGTAPSGNELYATNCQACHGSLANSTVNSRTAAGFQAAISSNVGGMGSLSLTTSEAQAIVDALTAATPPTTTPPPPQDRTGQQVYDQECAICHVLNTYDTIGSFELAGLGSAITPKIQGGHNNKDQAVTAGELTALANFADTFSPVAGGVNGGPVTGACDSCHGQPPNGSSFPNTMGAHATHTALNGVGTTCDNCHSGAAHNSLVDLGLAAQWDAKSGLATGNGDGTCSNISCHGGVKTPVWGSGSINVATQCTSCHTSGTSQYNGYSSGRHSKHVNSERIACITCHDTAKLNSGHFSDLSTSSFELSPAATIKSSIGYSGGRCSTASCHGGKSW